MIGGSFIEQLVYVRITGNYDKNTAYNSTSAKSKNRKKIQIDLLLIRYRL